MIESKDNEELTKIGQCIKEKRNLFGAIYILGILR